MRSPHPTASSLMHLLFLRVECQSGRSLYRMYLLSLSGMTFPRKREHPSSHQSCGNLGLRHPLLKVLRANLRPSAPTRPWQYRLNPKSTFLTPARNQIRYPCSRMALQFRCQKNLVRWSRRVHHQSFLLKSSWTVLTPANEVYLQWSSTLAQAHLKARRHLHTILLPASIGQTQIRSLLPVYQSLS